MNANTHSAVTTHLILGGARSGKSRYAESIAAAAAHSQAKNVVYIATATVFDEEMAQRVKHHQNDRPAEWLSVEEPLKLSEALQTYAAPDAFVIVDCLTMWLNNLLMEKGSTNPQDAIQTLLDTVPNLKGDVAFVSNEVSMGVVPLGELTRQFVDESGRLHQQLAQRVDDVIFMVAGIPTVIKGSKPLTQ